jgi:hypothetical protein
MALDDIYHVLLKRPWLRDAKVSHDWGKNPITIKSNGDVRMIVVTKKTRQRYKILCRVKLGKINCTPILPCLLLMQSIESNVKPIIKLFYIECFEFNNQRQENFSLFCIQFQFSNCFNKFFICFKCK